MGIGPRSWDGPVGSDLGSPSSPAWGPFPGAGGGGGGGRTQSVWVSMQCWACCRAET